MHVHTWTRDSSEGWLVVFKLIRPPLSTLPHHLAAAAGIIPTSLFSHYRGSALAMQPRVCVHQRDLDCPQKLPQASCLLHIRITVLQGASVVSEALVSLPTCLHGVGLCARCGIWSPDRPRRLRSRQHGCHRCIHRNVDESVQQLEPFKAASYHEAACHNIINTRHNVTGTI